jgi:hypothetical protein
LLADALHRSVRSEIASFAVIVDAKDDDARRFYEREGWTLTGRVHRRSDPFVPWRLAQAAPYASLRRSYRRGGLDSHDVPEAIVE